MYAEIGGNERVEWAALASANNLVTRRSLALCLLHPHPHPHIRTSAYPRFTLQIIIGAAGFYRCQCQSYYLLVTVWTGNYC